MYGLSINSGLCFGMLAISILSACILPGKEDEYQVILENKSWRIVFGSSIVVELASIIGLLFFFRNPSIKDMV